MIFSLLDMFFIDSSTNLYLFLPAISSAFSLVIEPKRFNEQAADTNAFSLGKPNNKRVKQYKGIALFCANNNEANLNISSRVSLLATAPIIFGCSRRNNPEISPNVAFRVTTGSIKSFSTICPKIKTLTPDRTVTKI
ncbi:hypothetical protein FB443_103181 [Vibrio crassostreae]|nr:hypothetical protein EDB31_1237 [Vibrio crassostreae]TQL39994.1 hypothetical protein FB443_103181 [Vibrio crassostreae]